MPGQDRIEIEQNGRTLRGSGTLRVSAGVAGQGDWRVLPTVVGIVTFDERVTLRDLEAVDSAEVLVTLARGGRHASLGAVMMNPTGDNCGTMPGPDLDDMVPGPSTRVSHQNWLALVNAEPEAEMVKLNGIRPS